MSRIFISIIIFTLWCGSEEVIVDLTHNACHQYSEYPEAYLSPNCYHNPNVLSDMTSIVKRSGYALEAHPVVTQDGYILTLHRIPPKNPGAQAVFLQHGILCNDIVWVDKFNQSLAFALHDAGYDVWMGNVRGSTYSKRHMTLSINDNKFWNFNLDTIAANDIPTFLRYIAGTTGKTGSTIYIGHSMGTTLSFMYASENAHEAGMLLRGIVSLAPVAYLDHNLMVKMIAPFWEVIRILLWEIGIRVLFINEDVVRRVAVKICKSIPAACVILNELIYGNDSGQISPDDLLLYFSSWPVTSAVDQFIHYLQICHSKQFQKFDYGVEDNRRIYGSVSPPRYNLGDIKLPVYLFTGPNDLLEPEEDVRRLFHEIGSSQKKMIEVNKEHHINFNHIDFIYAKDAQQLLFPEILKVLKNDLSS